MDRTLELSLADLAALVGCSVERLRKFRELGLLPEQRELSGPSIVNRLRLILALVEAGTDPELLAEALQGELLSLDFTKHLMVEPVALTRHLPEQVLPDFAVSFERIRRLRNAMGLPELQSGRPMRDDDVELVEIVSEASALGLGDESLARVLRIFGQSMRRTVETMRDLFRGEVEERLLAGGMARSEMLARTAELRLKLQRLGFRTLFLLQRRLLEEAVFDNVVMRLQEILIEADRTMVQGPHPSTVVFADLAGFTVLTQEIGDAPAAERAAEFEALAHEVAVAKGGRLIKALGDGVMLLFGDAPSAAEAAIHLAAGASTLPPARIGLATGVIVPRDGDVFGRTVNMAARICAKARTNEVLVCEVTRAVIENAVPGAFTFAALDPVELKGFSAPVELYQTRALRPIAFGWQTTGDTPAHVSPTM